MALGHSPVLMQELQAALLHSNTHVRAQKAEEKDFSRNHMPEEAESLQLGVAPARDWICVPLWL